VKTEGMGLVVVLVQVVNLVGPCEKLLARHGIDVS
jgi:hypothetical protein